MPPADGSSTVAYRFVANQTIMDPKIAADLRPSADGSAHLWWPAVTKLQAASVPIAQAGSCVMGQTDGRIALFRNAPPGRRHNNFKVIISKRQK